MAVTNQAISYLKRGHHEETIYKEKLTALRIKKVAKGHARHKKAELPVQGVGSVIGETVQTIAPTDAYAHEKAISAFRGAAATIWHKDYGLDTSTDIFTNTLNERIHEVLST